MSSAGKPVKKKLENRVEQLEIAVGSILQNLAHMSAQVQTLMIALDAMDDCFTNRGLLDKGEWDRIMTKKSEEVEKRQQAMEDAMSGEQEEVKPMEAGKVIQLDIGKGVDVEETVED